MADVGNVTDYTGPRATPPAPKKHWPFAAAMVALVAVFLLWAGLAFWWQERTPEPAEATIVTVTRVVTVVMPTEPIPTPRTIVVYQPTVVEVEVTREVTRVVNTNTFYTPTPPQNGRG